jgi:hypothetical protein
MGSGRRLPFGAPARDGAQGQPERLGAGLDAPPSQSADRQSLEETFQALRVDAGLGGELSAVRGFE